MPLAIGKWHRLEITNKSANTTKHKVRMSVGHPHAHFKLIKRKGHNWRLMAMNVDIQISISAPPTNFKHYYLLIYKLTVVIYASKFYTVLLKIQTNIKYPYNNNEIKIL